ncbi:endonuclease [Pedobacter sp. Leaf216]|nr:endonuclease [Pedobacter sp. Leaf216]
MSRIRGINTKAEIKLRKALWSKNVRFRIHSNTILGKPDIYITKYKLLIFVDGDFWHGYNWQQKKERIKTNTEFWQAKIERNIKRDEQVNRSLSEKGFTVMRFWEHQIQKKLSACINQVLLYIESAKNGRIPDPE